MKPAFRLQVALTTEAGSFLVAEVIGEAEEFLGWAPGILARYAAAKAQAGKPLGGAIVQRADLPRHWDVPVGGRIS